MAFSSLTNEEIEVGRAIKQELFQKIKDSLDDHEARLSLAIAGASKIEVINSDVLLGSFGNTVTGLVYYEALQDMTLVEGAIQIFNKNGISSGILSIDIKKNSTPDNLGMVSVFTTPPSIDFSTALDFDRVTGVFDVVNQVITKGEILRLDIISMPVGLGNFRVITIGEI